VAVQAALLETVSRRAHEFDVIHSHIDWLHLPLLGRAGVPFLTTCHGRLDIPGLSTVVDLFPDAPFVSISKNQRLPLPNANWLGTVYHGLPEQSLRPSYESEGYLAFLGRLTAEKGPETAIRIARAAGKELRIAAKIPSGERRYFKDRLEPMVDGAQIQIIGEVDDSAKQGFLAGADALLFPIDWPEPFGLVMIEAMACGTPVIAFPRGSVPEVIENGVTGFIVDDEEDAVQAVKSLALLDRGKVRRAFERRFTARRMAEDYVGYYRKLLGPVSAQITLPDAPIRAIGNIGQSLATRATANESKTLSPARSSPKVAKVQPD
jgi:glycosyltransferase involved in cell wall biosynthesis